MKIRRYLRCAAWLAVCCLLFCGCGSTEPAGKIRDLEFTVLEEEQIPGALGEVIQENLATEMKLSYQNDGFLYIARGFGEQPTGGYSISVEQCYLADDGIHVKFRLIGPGHDKQPAEEPSYPYLVIKTEAMDEMIQFE